MLLVLYLTACTVLQLDEYVKLGEIEMEREKVCVCVYEFVNQISSQQLNGDPPQYSWWMDHHGSAVIVSVARRKSKKHCSKRKAFDRL